MKKFDYIVIQAPMISELGLKGNSLLLFALIHSYTRDQKHTFRASLEDMAEWFTTSEGAISSTLTALEKSGYINKLGPKSAPEYTTNFEALMEKAEVEGALKMQRVYEKTSKKRKRLLNQKGAQKAVESRTTESVGLLNQKGKPTETVGISTTETVATPYKYNYINIYKYYSCYGQLTEEQKQEEQKQFFKIFFFKGAADPAEEVKRFIGHNQANGWQNKAGAKYDSTDKRLGLAELWQFQGQREGKTFLKVWEEVYSRLAEIENADILLDPRIKFTYTADSMAIHCTQEEARFIEANVSKVIDIFKAHAAGKKISYKFIY